jgi:hypothetical protein
LQKQPAEEARQHPDGKKEAWPAGDPSLATGREAAARNDTVQVGVMRQVLPPRMKDGEKADLGAQVLRIKRDRTKGLGRRLEQDVVDLGFVLIGDDGDLVGDREDHVEIFRIEQFSLAILDPLSAGQ